MDKEDVVYLSSSYKSPCISKKQGRNFGKDFPWSYHTAESEST